MFGKFKVVKNGPGGTEINCTAEDYRQDALQELFLHKKIFFSEDGYRDGDRTTDSWTD